MYNLKKKELYKILTKFHKFYYEMKILVSKKQNNNNLNIDKENNCINVYKIKRGNTIRFPLFIYYKYF